MDNSLDREAAELLGQLPLDQQIQFLEWLKKRAARNIATKVAVATGAFGLIASCMVAHSIGVPGAGSVAVGLTGIASGWGSGWLTGYFRGIGREAAMQRERQAWIAKLHELRPTQ